MDLSMPGRSGMELIKAVRAEKPQLRILVLSMLRANGIDQENSEHLSECRRRQTSFFRAGLSAKTDGLMAPFPRQ